jgi:hypothetical protein
VGSSIKKQYWYNTLSLSILALKAAINPCTTDREVYDVIHSTLTAPTE